jgi:hypothetical protein
LSPAARDAIETRKNSLRRKAEGGKEEEEEFLQEETEETEELRALLIHDSFEGLKGSPMPDLEIPPIDTLRLLLTRSRLTASRPAGTSKEENRTADERR